MILMTPRLGGTILIRFFLLKILSLYSFTILAQQGSINGWIESADGTPVSHVTIRIDGLNVNVVTDSTGYYSLNSIAYGSYILKATSFEIKPIYKSFNLYKPSLQLDLVVEGRKEVDLEEIVVNQHSVKQEIERSGFAAHVIEVKEAALRNVQVNELLDQAIGVRVRQNGGFGAEVEYNLNGMSGRSVGIFVDGIDISTYGSSFSLSNIPTSMIERIEVYKGVLPIHLSGDLLGGAINVVLKKQAATNVLNASISYGSFNTQQADVNGTFRNPTNGFTLRGSAFYSFSDNDYEIWGKFARNTLPDGTMENVRAKRFFDAYKSMGGRFETGFTDVPWADLLLLGVNLSNTYNELQHGQYMSQPYMGRFSESDASVFSLNYQKNHFLINDLLFRVNGVYSSRDQFVQDTVTWAYNWSGEKMIGFHGNPIKTAGGAQQGAPTMNNIKRQIATLRSAVSYELYRGHRLTMDHMYYDVSRQDHDRIRHVAEQVYRSTSSMDKQIYSVAYEADWMRKRLKTNLFGKYYQQSIQRVYPYVEIVNGQQIRAENRISDNRSMMGFGFAGSFTLNARTVFISSAERAVRMPVEAEIFGGPEENIVANPSLKPEISNNLNLGLRFNVLQQPLHRLSFSFNGFSRNTKDKIVRKAEDRLVNEAVQSMPFENLGLAQSIGFEAELHYQWGQNFNANFNLSRFNTLYKQEFDPNSGLRLDRYNKQVPNEPFFTANTQLNYRLADVLQKNSALNMYYHLGYVSPFNTIWIETSSTTTPRQLTQDLGVNYRFPNRKLVISIDVKNVLDAEVYDNFAVQKPGRAVYFKLNYTISTF